MADYSKEITCLQKALKIAQGRKVVSVKDDGTTIHGEISSFGDKSLEFNGVILSSGGKTTFSLTMRRAS